MIKFIYSPINKHRTCKCFESYAWHDIYVCCISVIFKKIMSANAMQFNWCTVVCQPVEKSLKNRHGWC
ncbi:hypothetical protein CBL_06976 [Carabus blaptoides fortunei]